MATEQFPAYSDETTPDGGRKRTIGPIVARASVLIIGMVFATVLLIMDKVDASDLPVFRVPYRGEEPRMAVHRCTSFGVLCAARANLRTGRLGTRGLTSCWCVIVLASAASCWRNRRCVLADMRTP